MKERMSPQNTFAQRLRQSQQLVGTMVSVASPEMVELLSVSGFDWLFIDMEHGAIDVSQAQRLLQAMHPPCAGIVRVPQNEETWFKKVLDIGAAGVIVPQVNSVAEAKTAVQCSKYPPQGQRGAGIARAHGYGRSFTEYVQTANDQIALIVQIEHIAAVEAVEEIAAVPGIDALLVGPYDLSGSLGLLGQVTAPPVTAAIDRVTAVAQQAGKPLGIFGTSVEAVRPYQAKGYTLLTIGTDTLLMHSAAQQIVTAFAA